MALLYGAEFISQTASANKPHILGFQTARSVAADTLFEVWNGPTNAALKFSVDKDGKVTGGSLFVGGTVPVSIGATDLVQVGQSDTSGVALGSTGFVKAISVSNAASPGAFGGVRARVGPAPVQSGDLIAQFSGHAYDGSAYSRGASMFVVASETWSGTARGSYWDIRARTPTTTTEVTVLLLSTVSATFGTVAGTGSLPVFTGDLTVASGKAVTLTGVTISGQPTWSSSQAITLSTAAQPNITSVGTLTSLVVVSPSALPAAVASSPDILSGTANTVIYTKNATIGALSYQNDFGLYPAIQLHAVSGTPGSVTAVTSASIIGAIRFGGATSSSTYQNDSAIVYAVSTQQWTVSVRGAELRFGTVLTGANTTIDRWAIQGTSGHWIPGSTATVTDNTYDIGIATTQRIRSLYAGTSVISPVFDSGSATDLLLKRNAVTKATFANALTTFADPVTVTGLLTGSAGFTLTGTLTMATAVSKLVPGATSFSHRNNADNADNLIITDAGAVTTRGGLTITTGGLGVAAGNVTITTGTLTVNNFINGTVFRTNSANPAASGILRLANNEVGVAYRNAANSGDVAALNVGPSNEVQVGGGGAASVRLGTAGGNILICTDGGGVQIGSPTGGDKGAGTLNLTSLFVSGTQVVSSRRTGWTAWTGTADRTTHNADGPATVTQLGQALKALVDDLIAHGMIGT